MNNEPTTDRITEYQEKLDDINEQITATELLMRARPERWTLKYILEDHQNHKKAIEDILELLRNIPADETEVEKETIKLIQQRNKVGRETYGTGLNHSDLQYRWPDEALQEIADALKYVMAQKLRVQHGIEITDKNIKYVAGKIFYDRTGRVLEDEIAFIKRDWYIEAEERIENYNYLTQLLWGENDKTGV